MRSRITHQDLHTYVSLITTEQKKIIHTAYVVIKQSIHLFNLWRRQRLYML